MGSRGIYGFYKNGVTKTTYRHSCSYPIELGEVIADFIKNTSIQEMNEIFDKIIMVREENKPNEQQIEECKQYYNGEVYEKRIDEWYNLLHKTQGTLTPYKKGLKYMLDSEDFITNSLSCEWGWIINLDNNELEIYVGFQDTPNNNRYSVKKPDDYGYYNCALFKSIPLNKVKKSMMREIENEYKLLEKDKAP